jgi:hypothetical protein
MPVTFDRTARGDDLRADTLAALESAVRAALGELERPVSVRFAAWADDGQTRYLCQIETPPAGPFEEEQWRWWSPLFDTPEELESALREAVRRRQRGEATRPGRAALAPPSAVRA